MPFLKQPFFAFTNISWGGIIADVWMSHSRAGDENEKEIQDFANYPFYYGGTVEYSAILYKIIDWNQLEGKQGTELHIFPTNFHSLDYYDR